MKRLLTLIKRALSGEGGFSLVEVTTVSMLLGCILASAYMATGAVSNVSDGINARNAAQSQGQLALEKMVRELRQGTNLWDANQQEYRFAQNTPTCCSFYADADHNGTIDRVTYTLSGGLLTRKVAQSGKPAPYPTDFGSDASATVLANVDPSVTTMFQYLDGSQPPNLVTDQGSVKAVVINLTTIAHSGNTTMSVSFPPTEVQVREFPVGTN